MKINGLNIPPSPMIDKVRYGVKTVKKDETKDSKDDKDSNWLNLN